MKLKTAIRKFEKGRTSTDDYMCVSYKDPKYPKGMQSVSVSGKDLKTCGECDVIKYEPFEGHCMSFNIFSLKMSKDRTCRAVSIIIDADQAKIALNRK